MKRIGLIIMVTLAMSLPIIAQIINVPLDQPTIQAGINAASNGDTVLVVEGTYFENINYKGKAITVASHFLLDSDTAHISNTIIDGSQSVSIDTATTVIMNSGEDTTSVLCGFTITKGYGTIITLDGNMYRAGGGILLLRSGGLIQNNKIVSNSIGSHQYRLGDGICAMVSNNHTVVIRKNRIMYNGHAGFNYNEGGGVSLIGGRIILENNQISYNRITVRQGVDGVGVAYRGSDEPGVIPEVIINNNVISGNEFYTDGLSRGEGMRLNGNGQDVDVWIQNNLIFDNTSNGSDGEISLSGIQVTFLNNTIVNRIPSSYYWSHIYLEEDAHATLINNIICSVRDTSHSEIILEPESGNSLIAKYNLIKGGWPGEGNLNLMPGFSNDSFDLKNGSPCVGSGVDSIEVEDTWYNAPATDVYGNVRPHPVDGLVDLGAIESPYERPIYIPDTAFLYALIEEGVDTNGDSLISYNEAESTHCLYLGKWPEEDISRMNISDLTGIEAFINLDTLICDYIRIKELDLSHNLKLIYLSCVYDTYYGGRGDLTELDLSNNTSLRYLNCYCNKIGNLDLTNLPDLNTLNCGDNQLTSLDISANHKLENLKCVDNQLTSLDLSGNPELSILECWNNQISLLDLSENNHLEDLVCSKNQLTLLDVSTSPQLKSLILEDNQVASLDVSNNPDLEEIWCDNNQLTSLDLSGCRALTKFICRNNPLTTVCTWETFIDDVLVVTEGSPEVSFISACGSNPVSIPDTAFLYALIELGVDTNGDNLISYAEAEVVTDLQLGDYRDVPRKISDLTGIEAFVNIRILYCERNQLINLDLSNNTYLNELVCYTNQLTSLNISKNTDLTRLDCSNNNLINLEVSKNTALETLYCSNNDFTHLDVSNNTVLRGLICDNNQLTSLDLTNNDSLRDLECIDNQLIEINLSNNAELIYLDCSGNQFDELSIASNAKLEFLRCSNNKLYNLFLENNVQLCVLQCGGNELDNLDISNNINIGSSCYSYHDLWTGGTLNISNMPTLNEVCVWESFHPDSIICAGLCNGNNIDTTGSPNVCFETDCDGMCENTRIKESVHSVIAIYPIPTGSLLTIETDSPKLYFIEITSTNGQQILNKEFEGLIHQIDLSSFQKGVYFITIRSKDFVTTRKIIKL